MMLMSATGWQIGLVLGLAVVAVAAAIVIAIVVLAMRIARQAKTAVGAVEVVRATDRRARRHRADQRLRRAHPALRTGPAKGGGRANDATLAAISIHTYWGIALVDRPGRGAGRCGPAHRAAQAVGKHREVGRRAARGRRQGRREHREHPAARGNGARAGPDRRRGGRPGRLHERADRRVRRAHELQPTYSSS